MRQGLLALAVLVGSMVIAAAISLKPTGLDRCIGIISADIERQAAQTAATLDPRDVEVSAARACASIQD